MSSPSLEVGSSGREFAAFISYAHEAERPLAQALERSIEQFPRLWFQPRPRRVFLDDSDLAPGSSLSAAIEDALSRADRLVLLASPTSAASSYVDAEVAWWLEHRSVAEIIIVLTDGDISWDRAAERLDRERTTALPPALVGDLGSEPFFVDVRAIRRRPVDADDADWQSVLAGIVSTLDGVAKDTLIGAHVLNARRWRRRLLSIILVLVVLASSTAAAAVFAAVQRNRALEQADIATTRQLASTALSLVDTRIDLARLLAVEAVKTQRSPAARSALLQTLAASPQLMKFIPTTAAVTMLRTTADGRFVLVGDDGGGAQVVTSVGERVAGVDLDSPVRAVAYDDSRDTLAVATSGGVEFWPQVSDPARSGSIRSDRAGSDRMEVADPILDMTVDQLTGSLVILSAVAEENGGQSIGRVRLVDPASLTITASTDIDLGSADFIFTESPGTHIAVRPDRMIYVAAGACRHVGLGLPNLARVVTVEGLCEPANRFIATASPTATSGAFMRVGGKAEVYEGEATEPRRFAAFPIRQPQVIGLARDGVRLAVSENDRILVGDTAPDPATSTAVTSLTGTSGISAIEFLDHNRLASAGSGGVALWDTTALGPLARGTGVSTPDATGFIESPEVTVAPDSRHVAVVAEDATVHIIDPTLQTPPITLPAASLHLPAVAAWAPDSQSLAVIGGDGQGQRWSLTGGQPALAGSWDGVAESDRDQTDSAVWTPDQALLIVGHDGSVLRADSVGEPLRKTTAKTDKGNGLLRPQLSADGRWLVRSNASTLEMLDLQAGTRRDLGPAADVAYARFDGTEHLLVGRRNTSIDVRDVETGVVDPGLARQDVIVDVLAAGIAAATTVTGTITVYDMAAGQTMGTITIPPATGPTISASVGTATALGLTADGKTLVTATSAGDVLVWTLDTPSQIREACKTAGHDISAEDWRRLVGSDPPADLRCGR